MRDNNQQESVRNQIVSSRSAWNVKLVSFLHLSFLDHVLSYFLHICLKSLKTKLMLVSTNIFIIWYQLQLTKIWYKRSILTRTHYSYAFSYGLDRSNRFWICNQTIKMRFSCHLKLYDWKKKLIEQDEVVLLTFSFISPAKPSWTADASSVKPWLVLKSPSFPSWSNLYIPCDIKNQQHETNTRNIQSRYMAKTDLLWNCSSRPPCCWWTRILNCSTIDPQISQEICEREVWPKGIEIWQIQVKNVSFLFWFRRSTTSTSISTCVFQISGNIRTVKIQPPFDMFSLALPLACFNRRRKSTLVPFNGKLLSRAHYDGLRGDNSAVSGCSLRRGAIVLGLSCWRYIFKRGNGFIALRRECSWGCFGTRRIGRWRWSLIKQIFSYTWSLNSWSSLNEVRW